MAKRNKRLAVSGSNVRRETACEVNRSVSEAVGDCVWKAETDYGVEYGSLEYVLAELSKSGLCYHFCGAGEREHEHTFTGVLRALVADPKFFSVEGFEKEYSEQELHFLKRVQEELCDGKRIKKV